MTTQGLFSKVPFHSHGDHLTGTQTITDFPDLHAGPVFEERAKTIKQSLRRQIIYGKPTQAAKYVQIRECFKFREKKYIQFCLQNKVPGITFEEAAKSLGIRK